MKKDYVVTLLICALLCFVVTTSDDVRQGAQSGIALCENVVIPSLLPILILTNTIVRYRGSRLFEMVLGRFFEKVFRLPRCTVAAVVLGLVGGYPAGALLTYRLYEEGSIDDAVARRLMSFNFCGGIAFIITAVGTVCYGSTRSGVMLYLSNVGASVIMCFIGRFFASAVAPQDNNAIIKTNFSDSLIGAVDASAKAIITMCMYIVLFSAITSMVSVPQWAVPLVEITNGVCGGEVLMPLKYCALFLSFGGFCIHSQILGLLTDMKVKYFRFLIERIANALLSYGLMLIIQGVTGDSADVFSTVNQVSNSLCKVNAGLSIAFIIGCAVLILEIEGKKSKLLYS